MVARATHIDRYPPLHGAEPSQTKKIVKRQWLASGPPQTIHTTGRIEATAILTSMLATTDVVGEALDNAANFRRKDAKRKSNHEESHPLLNDRGYDTTPCGTVKVKLIH